MSDKTEAVVDSAESAATTAEAKAAKTAEKSASAVHRTTDAARNFAERQNRPTGWHLEHDTAPSLHGWVAGQMGKGAFFAAILFFGILLFIYALRLISRILPEDPYAALDAVQRVLT